MVNIIPNNQDITHTYHHHHQDKLSSSSPSTDLFHCQWQQPPCSEIFTDPETLYRHLCDRHIGRRSTGNLTLRCHWKDCETVCIKRDHITSHLRVHTPLKPHNCQVCGKAFKRPQDLKKHEKIHTQEHHIHHKHSKALKVSNLNSHSNTNNRNYVPLPLHAQALQSNMSSNSNNNINFTPSVDSNQFNWLSVRNLAQQQQDLNNSATIHNLAQLAAEQAYQSVIASSSIGSRHLSESPQSVSISSNTSIYPPLLPSLTTTSHTNPISNVNPTISTSPADPSQQLRSSLIDYSSLNVPTRERTSLSGLSPTSTSDRLSDQALSPSFSQDHSYYSSSDHAPTPPHSSNNPRASLSPFNHYQLSPAHSSGNNSHHLQSHSNDEIFQSLYAPRHSLPTDSLSSGSGSNKRDYDEVVNDLFLRCKKRNKHEDNNDENICRLTTFLSPDVIVNLPALESHSSSDTPSPASSPHPYPTDPNISSSSPFDLDWLADKSAADELTNMLANIGSEIESSTAAMFGSNWPELLSCNLLQQPTEQQSDWKPRPSQSSQLVPHANTEVDRSPSQTQIHRQSSTASFFNSMPPSVSGPTSTYPVLPACFPSYPNLQPPSVECPIRVSKPLAPPQISAVSTCSVPMSLHKVNPLQRASPSSAVHISSPDSVHSEGSSAHIELQVGKPGSGCLDGPHRSSGRDESLELAPMSSSEAKRPSGMSLPPLRAIFGDAATNSLPSSAVSPPSSPPILGSFFTHGRSSAAPNQTSVYPSLTSLSALSLTKTSDEIYSPINDKVETTDSLVHSVRGMHLASRKTSVASLRSVSSPSSEDKMSEVEGELGESINEEDEANQEGEDDDDEQEGGVGEDLPHKRFRLSSRLARRSAPSSPSYFPDSTGNKTKILLQDREKLEEAQKKLRLIHGLIIRINEAHRAIITRRSASFFQVGETTKSLYGYHHHPSLTPSELRYPQPSYPKLNLAFRPASSPFMPKFRASHADPSSINRDPDPVDHQDSHSDCSDVTNVV